ncbi:MAG TPA: hypothetical protein VJC16_05840 [Candidatus Nanoarchaeia archaeon]|nr:hypothetical protein [Candidatus Nanoarchaeia archaeon]
MDRLRILNTKERKGLIALLRQQFGFAGRLDYAFLRRADGDIFVADAGAFALDFSQLHLNSIGLYFGELQPDGLRLSIEGSQIVGPGAAHHTIGLDDAQKEMWMKGEAVAYPGKETGFVLVRSADDFLGCGKISGGKILNYVPKARRLHEVNG